MKPKIIHDFIHWSDSDLQLTDILDEYTVSESDSDLSGLENATKRRKTSANETTQKNNHKVTKPSSKTGEQKKKSCTYMCPSCEKILKTIPGFRGHVQKQHGLMNLKATQHRIPGDADLVTKPQVDIPHASLEENELPEGPPSINTSPRPTKGPSGIAYECSLKDGVKIALETIITDPFNSMDNSHSILELARSMDDSFCERYCSQIEDAMTDIVGSVGFGVSFQLDRELMFSKFHTLRCTSEFVDSVVDLVSQYANSNTISVAPVFVQILLEETLDAFLNTFITSKVSEVREVPVSDNDQAVLFYIAGFIVHSTLKRYGESMSGLQQRLTARATDTEPTFLSKHRFWIEKCDRGGLKQPSDSFFLLIRQCENVLRDYIDIDKLDKNTLMQEATQERLLDDFMVKHHWDQCAQGVCVESSMKLLDHITRLFLRVRGAAIQRYKQRQLQKRVKKSGKRKSSLRGGLGEKH